MRDSTKTAAPPFTQADLDALSETAPGNPTHIWIEPTSRCNTRCTHCGHFYSDFGQDMAAGLYQRIADSIMDGLESAELIGYGEPLMAKVFWQMVEDCAARGIKMYTTSNGILLRNEERVAKLVRLDIVLCLSVDGARRETFEAIRPFVKWDGIIKTLECIRRNAEAAGAERRFRMRFNFVPMRQNIADMPDLVRMAAEYGADEVFILPLAGEEVFPEVSGQSVSGAPECVSPAFLEALRLGSQLGVRIDVPPAYWPLIVRGRGNGGGLAARIGRLMRRAAIVRAKVRQMGVRSTFAQIRRRRREPRGKAGVTHCTMPWNDTYFAADGAVYPCCIMGEKLGDMNQQSWEEIWNGPAYRNLRRTIHGWNPTAVCRACALPTGINGGDERHHENFFARFREETVPLDAPEVRFGEGFHVLERHADGSPSHIWMSRRGTLELPARPAARFVRLTINHRTPVSETNPGRCRVNGGPPEHFDNTCDHLHFPLERDGRAQIRLELEMVNGHHVPPDTRELALAIRGIQWLVA